MAGDRGKDGESMMDESLIKALHSAQFATGELQDALKTADAVTALVILPMIADAARLAQQISGLIHARKEI